MIQHSNDGTWLQWVLNDEPNMHNPANERDRQASNAAQSHTHFKKLLNNFFRGSFRFSPIFTPLYLSLKLQCKCRAAALGGPQHSTATTEMVPEVLPQLRKPHHSNSVSPQHSQR